VKICRLTKAQYSEFFRFNREIYPTRRDVEERFRSQILDNPLLEEESGPTVLVAHSADGQIIGQFVLMPLDERPEGKRSRSLVGI